MNRISQASWVINKKKTSKPTKIQQDENSIFLYRSNSSACGSVYFAVILRLTTSVNFSTSVYKLEGRNKELTEKITSMDSMYREVLNYVPDSEKGRLENKGLYEGM